MKSSKIVSEGKTRHRLAINRGMKSLGTSGHKIVLLTGLRLAISRGVDPNSNIHYAWEERVRRTAKHQQAVSQNVDPNSNNR